MKKYQFVLPTETEEIHVLELPRNGKQTVSKRRSIMFETTNETDVTSVNKGSGKKDVPTPVKEALARRRSNGIVQKNKM